MIAIRHFKKLPLSLSSFLPKFPVLQGRSGWELAELVLHGAEFVPYPMAPFGAVVSEAVVARWLPVES